MCWRGIVVRALDASSNPVRSSGQCLLYKLAGFYSFQETFYIKMDLSRDHFYKTIEEAKTAIKQYCKVYYFSHLIRPRRIENFLFVGNRTPTNNKIFIRRESPPYE